MKIEKSGISAGKALSHCIKNIELGNYRYVTVINIEQNDINIYNDWLLEMECMEQDYFLMFTETNGRYKKLCGCSGFKIISMLDSTATVYPTESINTPQMKDLLSSWIEECDCYYASGAIKRISDKIIAPE